MLQAIEAEPALVSTTQAAAEAIVGQEFHDEQDFLLGIETIAELGARSVLIAYDLGLFALIREDRRERRFHVIPPEVEVVSAVGAGDVALGAFVAARIVDDKPGTNGIWKRLTFLSPLPSTQNTTDVFSTGHTPGLPGTSGCCHDDGLPSFSKT